LYIKQPEQYFLTTQEELAIIRSHRIEKDKRIADRLKTILILNKGFSFLEVSELLLLDENTIRGTYELYITQGLQSVLSFNYVSGLSYLSTSEIAELEKHLEAKMYFHSKDIRHYIEKKYGVVYTVEGVRGLLKRLNFVYKKTKHIPGKGDLEKQKSFVNQYRELKAHKSKCDKIYFMDGVHPGPPHQNFNRLSKY
jgi:transposase